MTDRLVPSEPEITSRSPRRRGTGVADSTEKFPRCSPPRQFITGPLVRATSSKRTQPRWMMTNLVLSGRRLRLGVESMGDSDKEMLFGRQGLPKQSEAV